MNGTIYNSAVEYHCIPQYERIGPYLRKCLENGQWSGDEPRCESNYLCFSSHFGQKICWKFCIITVLAKFLATEGLHFNMTVYFRSYWRITGHFQFRNKHRYWCRSSSLPFDTIGNYILETVSSKISTKLKNYFTGQAYLSMPHNVVASWNIFNALKWFLTSPHNIKNGSYYNH